MSNALTWLSSLIPPANTRLPVTTDVFLTKLLPPVVAYYLTAVLVILPGTFFLRVAILPLTLWFAFHAVTSVDIALTFGELGFKCLDFGLGLNMIILAMRMIEWTSYREPLRRVSDREGSKPVSSEPTVTLGSALWDACDLATNFRGIGWTFSRGLTLPIETRCTTSTPTFLAQTLRSALLHFTLFDASVYAVRAFDPSTIGSPYGGTIFDAALPPTTRYARSTLISLLSGTMFYAVIQGIYDLNTVNFILLFRQHPARWPPLFGAPWAATSVARFWGAGWHQLFRSAFIRVGAAPVSLVVGRAGGVLGAFLLSAVLHDWGMWGMWGTVHFDRVGGFFLAMGLGCVFEGAFGKATGVRVGGMWGWVWTMAWVVGWGNLLVDAWARTGLLGSTIAPSGTGALINYVASGKPS
ncbi:hypothetical protein FIBSPDRAFT_966928 [Athelia psychrophila]|uniref:Wax synthase domain-containing protein n=1 Tax=Athelia psychrophila TaxID=1759441 RepID=A0A167W9N3_9AGAM|nr:hypothetical protein FIBSPDRAFT_966928 [Fibularhizoctonia sp. CBS 109695]